MKCLVWDLDNTLWRGTLLEGDEVTLDDAVRDVIRTLDGRGILQSIASKNDHEDAWARLEALGIAEYFLVPRIGWGPKSESVRRIAEELKFAPSTIAFVDDRPDERAEVAFHLPDVRCYPAEDLLGLVGRPEFTPATITEDSRQRRRMYQANARRVAEQSAFTGPNEEFLRSLDIRMQIKRATGDDLTRVAELTLRTSQMNATGVHYSDADLRALLTEPAFEMLTASMSDRFGPHGAIGVVLVETRGSAWHLRLLATSCRVVSYGAGAALLTWLRNEAARAGTHLVADFRLTGRNRMMEIAYRFAGFVEEPCSCLATVAEPRLAEIVRLHLVPRWVEPSPLIRITAPELGGHSLARACTPG